MAHKIGEMIGWLIVSYFITTTLLGLWIVPVTIGFLKTILIALAVALLVALSGEIHSGT